MQTAKSLSFCFFFFLVNHYRSANKAEKSSSGFEHAILAAITAVPVGWNFTYPKRQHILFFSIFEIETHDLPKIAKSTQQQKLTQLVRLYSVWEKVPDCTDRELHALNTKKDKQKKWIYNTNKHATTRFDCVDLVGVCAFQFFVFFKLISTFRLSALR